MATITKSDELRLHNRSRILSCLRCNSQSRTKISELTGLSSATVTQVTADLLEDGVIEKITPSAALEQPHTTKTRRGRPQVTLELRAQAATTAVITLLLNNLEVTLFDYKGSKLYQQKKHLITSRLTIKSLTRQLLTLLDSTLAKAPLYRDTLKNIAVVYQGIVSSDNKRLLWSPITGVRDFDLAALLHSNYGVNATVLNNSKTMASALYQQRKNDANQTSTDTGNMGVMLLSDGIGLGIFHQGTILQGSYSSGTEFGHMLLTPEGALCRCGRYGCIEAYASDYGIWRKAKGYPEHSAPEDEIDPGSFKQLIDKASATDGIERQAFREAGAAIGLGLANLYALLDPFPVIIVGTSPEAYNLMEESLQKNLSHFRVLNTQNLIAVHKTDSESSLILQGASMLALEYIDHEIFGFGQPVGRAIA